MMNAAIFLVPAVHEIAIAAELAIAARAAEKPDPNALTDHPALDAGTKRIDAADDLMAWDARPIDRKQALHCAGIRMADPTRLDADPHLARPRSVQCFFGQLQPTWADRLYCAIVRCCFHHYLPNGRAGIVALTFRRMFPPVDTLQVPQGQSFGRKRQNGDA